jgi:hypothetical protein
MSDADKKAYKNSRFMMHRFLSMNPHYLPIVNEAQKYTGIPDRAHYLFLTSLIPRGKQYNKYIKGAKEDKYEKWLVDIVAKHFHISKSEAVQYIEIYYNHDKRALREVCLMYGIDDKTLKKVKL